MTVAITNAAALAEQYRTDPAGWRLKVSEDSHGQHKWVYLAPGAAREQWPQTATDLYSMGLPPVRVCTVALREGMQDSTDRAGTAGPAQGFYADGGRAYRTQLLQAAANGGRTLGVRVRRCVYSFHHC